MKTYKHLYEKMLNSEYVEQSIINASRGKRNRVLVQDILNNPQKIINKTLRQIKDKTWTPPPHQKNKLKEGSHRKERIIEKPVFNNEQIVHHMLIGQLRPILEKKFMNYLVEVFQEEDLLLLQIDYANGETTITKISFMLQNQI